MGYYEKYRPFGQKNKWLISVTMGFCLAIFIVTLGGCIFSNAYGMTPVLIIAIMGITIALLFFVYRFFKQYSFKVQRYYWAIIGLGLGVLLITNIICGYLLRYEPIFDLGAIYTGAIQWVETGNFMEHINWTCDANYFYFFPNNLGGMTFLYVFFKTASVFGIGDYYAVAIIANAILTALTVLLTILICKKILGICESLIALLCFLLFPPFYFMSAVFYTDALSLVFPILIIYIYLKFLETESKKGKVFYLLLIGISCAVGMLVKFTVLIALIAAIIHYSLNKGILRALIVSAACAMLIIGVFAGFEQYMYANHLDESTAEKLRTPYSHWIMMSLAGDGRYNPQDYAFTRSFEDPNVRSKAIRAKIKARIEEQGITGMLQLFYEKESLAFGDGTLAQSDFLDDGPQHTTFLHKFLLYDSQYYEIYRYFASGIYFAFLFFACIAAYFSMKRKTANETLIPILCLCGIMMFLAFWEVTGRYATNYVPLLFLSAVHGLSRPPKNRIT